MQLNDDFGVRASVHASALDWVASPMPGVERKMLDRIGGEVARATSIVRYAPQSAFSAHVHTGGEEFLVLDGVFQDEHGDYPAGSYVRNPPQSKHTPGSAPGCVIFVKLWQFDLDDRHDVKLAPGDLAFAPLPQAPEIQSALLHTDARETVSLMQWPANTDINIPVVGGCEVLVLKGGFEQQGEVFSEHSWLRLPVGSDLTASTRDLATTVWVKTGHLLEPLGLPQS